jgi:hypothetical protein
LLSPSISRDFQKQVAADWRQECGLSSRLRSAHRFSGSILQKPVLQRPYISAAYFSGPTFRWFRP